MIKFMGLDSVELVMAIEEEFGIEIEDAAAETMQTPRIMIDYISMRCPDRERGAIAERVQEIIIEELCIDAAIYREDADFIKDFGMG